MVNELSTSMSHLGYLETRDPDQHRCTGVDSGGVPPLWLIAGIPDPPVRGMRTVVPAWAYGVSVHSGYAAYREAEQISDHQIEVMRCYTPDPDLGMSNIQISDIRNMGMSKMEHIPTVVLYGHGVVYWT